MPKLSFSKEKSTETNLGQNQVDSLKQEDDRPVEKAVLIKLRLDQIKPDFYQTRVILPSELTGLYYSGQINSFETGKKLLDLAKKDAGIGEMVSDLLSLGESIYIDSQIKPITGSWDPVDKHFIIETGERRFWGTMLYLLSNQPKEITTFGLKAVVVVPSRIRQIVENEKNAPPNALTRARSIAAVILMEYKIEPDDPQNPNRHSFYRKVNQIRISNEVWTKIENLFRLTRRSCENYLPMLDLPDNDLELINRYNIPERALRDALRKDKANHRFMYSPEQISNFIMELIETRRYKDTEDSESVISSNIDVSPNEITEAVKQRVHNIDRSEKFATKIVRELNGIRNNSTGITPGSLATDLYVQSNGHEKEIYNILSEICTELLNRIKDTSS